MKLHDVTRNSYIRVLPDPEEETGKRTEGLQSEAKVPVAALPVTTGEIIYFDHIDGMYSLCYKTKGSIETKDLAPDPEQSCHLVAWQEVEPLTVEEMYGDFEKIRESIGRSGYGKDGHDEFRKSALKDMSDEWVKASISFVPVDHPHKAYYEQELKYRKENNITIVDNE